MSALTFLLEPTTFLTGVVFALSIVLFLSKRRPAGLPPSPGVALPFIGHLHLLDKDPRVSFARWRQKYGDVFSLYMGGSLVIVLSGCDVIKEALMKNGDAFTDRPRTFVSEFISKNRGVAWNSGSVWKEQRKVSLESLREMGMGKNILAEKVQQEVSEYIKVIASFAGEAFFPAELIHVSISNNICSIVFGKRFEYNDAVFTKYMSMVEENFKIQRGTGLLNFFPLLHYLPGDLFKSKRVIANVATLQKTFIVPQIEKHRNEYHEDDASDFIHIYLRQIKKKETKGLLTSVNETNLIRVLSELFAAGTETTATAILWALVFFLHYPEVQEKCYEEIKRVVGTERAPTIHDKPEMTYNEATSMEVLRRGNIAPLSVPHSVAYDVTFKGYTLPKGATVFPVLESVLHDSAIWGDPLIFRPDRFIGPDGKLTRPEEFLPFSIGRRMCLGESLAKVELFLYLTTMIQRFRFVSPENEALPPLEGVLGLTLAPKPFKICALPRDFAASE